jgi:hypothetical protein
MKLHALIEDDPELRAVAAQIAALDASAAVDRKTVADLSAEHVPGTAAPPELGQASNRLHRSTYDRAQLVENRTKVLCRNAEEYLERLQMREDELLAESRELVALIDRMTPEAAELVRNSDYLRTLLGDRADRGSARVDARTLVEAVLSGRRFTDAPKPEPAWLS